MNRTSLCVATLLFGLLAGTPALADEHDRAARSFEDGERAFAAGDYSRAAQSFEEAYAVLPHASALFNAAKARVRGGDLARAASLYAKLERESTSARDREDARVQREALLPKLGRVEIVHADGPATVDGVIVSESPAYVTPGEHVISGRGQRKVVRVAGGDRIEVDLAREAPSLSRPPATGVEPTRQGLSPVLVFVAGGAALLAGGITTWSALDTVAQKDRFDRTGLDADLDEGLAKQTRTNVLLGVTVGLAAVTGLLVLLVDWQRGQRATSFHAPAL